MVLKDKSVGRFKIVVLQEIGGCLNSGLMEWWNDGMVECWSAGIMELWIVGLMECWDCGMMEY